MKFGILSGLSAALASGLLQAGASASPDMEGVWTCAKSRDRIGFFLSANGHGVVAGYMGCVPVFWRVEDGTNFVALVPNGGHSYGKYTGALVARDRLVLRDVRLVDMFTGRDTPEESRRNEVYERRQVSEAEQGEIRKLRAEIEKRVADAEREAEEREAARAAAASRPAAGRRQVEVGDWKDLAKIPTWIKEGLLVSIRGADADTPSVTVVPQSPVEVSVHCGSYSIGEADAPRISFEKHPYTGYYAPEVPAAAVPEKGALAKERVNRALAALQESGIKFSESTYLYGDMFHGVFMRSLRANVKTNELEKIAGTVEKALADDLKLPLRVTLFPLPPRP